ncbi:MAG: alpha/beta fold hydrolase [Rhizobiaceae bacterium]|nr:alpha/beta fold hydrolase [Rhizobiaceae bacterium]
MSELHAETLPGSGTPVVLLHGFGSTSAAWGPVIEALDSHAVLAYDLPGHGRSLAYPNAGSPGIAAKAIIADLAERGTGAAHFAGHSMGGAIATLVALMAPERVASLTLIAPGGYGPQINAPLLRDYGAAVEKDEITRRFLEMCGPEAEMPAGLAERMERDRGVAGQREMLEKIAALITRDGRQGVLPPADVAALAMPVAVIWGTEDRVLPYAQMATMPPDWTKITLEGAGHMLLEEAPGEVAKLIARMSV